MTKIFTLILSLFASLGLIILEQTALIANRSPLYNFVSVVAYSIFGTTILFLAYKSVDWLIPADIESEIFDKQNVAAAIFKGLLLVGIAIIIAAVIVAP
jgi:uncharacterized membrane protein YjfL (UPF0719 family)